MDYNEKQCEDEIAYMHRQANQQATSDGGAYYYKQEYVDAWEAFRDNPNIENARILIRVMPPILDYFEKCSPGQSYYSIQKYLRERGLSDHHTNA